MIPGFEMSEEENEEEDDSLTVVSCTTDDEYYSSAMKNTTMEQMTGPELDDWDGYYGITYEKSVYFAGR